jgi:hypothetical protein
MSHLLYRDYKKPELGGPSQPPPNELEGPSHLGPNEFLSYEKAEPGGRSLGLKEAE